MSKKLLFKGGHATGMIPCEIEDFSTLYLVDARVDEKTKAYIDSVIGNSVLNLCPYRNVLVTHKYDTVEGNVITLDDCQDDEVIQLSEVQGNTMVNCCKDGSKELTLNGDIDTSGYNNVTLTEGADGGKVDIALEGNTMVNVCDQEEPVAITKNYEVTTGNHVALQGEYDGKCRPNIYGNTLVSWQGSKNINKGQQVTINKQYETKSIHTLHTTVGDKVYFRIKFTVDEMNTTSAEPKIFTGYSMGYKIDVKAFKDCTVGKIEEASTIREHESARTDQTHMELCIGMYAPMPDDVPEGGVVCKYTVHDYVIYNLTQLFGAGKEPEQEWCDKNLPYLEGMQSSFEDKLITDEKDAHNGKYKVDYKVTGKNKYNSSKPISNNNIDNTGNLITSDSWVISDYNSISPNTNYTLSYTSDETSYYQFKIAWYDNNLNFIKIDYYQANSIYNYTYLSPNNAKYCRIAYSTSVSSKPVVRKNIQLEEGDTATTYEPYKEYTKTLYLNSPLLEGDTIEQSGNDIVHVHRYSSVVLDGSDDELWYLHNNTTTNCNEFRCTRVNNKDLPLMASSSVNSLCDKYITQSSGDIERFAWGGGAIYLSILKTKLDYDLNELRKYLNSNPITCLGELQTPTREVISTNDNLLLDSYKNGHLDMDSVVPIDKVVFQSYGTSLKYLSPNTEYTIQFESDSDGKLDALALNSSDVIGNLNVVKGINKFNITTSDKITINYLWTTGIGFNMSKIVVTSKVDGDFGYFKGMKSVGQNDADGHKIEILSSNSDDTLSNKKEIFIK